MSRVNPSVCTSCRGINTPFTLPFAWPAGPNPPASRQTSPWETLPVTRFTAGKPSPEPAPSGGMVVSKSLADTVHSQKRGKTWAAEDACGRQGSNLGGLRLLHQFPHYAVIHFHGRRRYIFFQVSDARGPGNRQHHRRAPQKPRQRQLRR